MDKIFQILAVLILLVLLISRFIRGREPRYLPYDFIKRFKPPLPPVVEARLITAVAGAPEELDADAVEGTVDMFVAAEGLVFCYGAEGRLTIFRQRGERYKQMQELSVPLLCTAMAFDPYDGSLYFETGGFLFLYGTRPN